MVRYRGNGGLTGVKNTTTTGSGGGFFARDEVYLDTLAGAFTQYIPAPIADPQFNLTTLLLHGDGSNSANNNTFQDSSTNAATITRNGTATQGTFSPFSQTGWSNYFGAADGNYLSFSTITFAGNFTLEYWIYPTAQSSSGQSVVFSNSSVNIQVPFFYADGSIGYYNNGTTGTSSAGKIALNVWSHVAVVRTSNVVKIYVNGTDVGISVSDATSLALTTLGGYGSGSSYNVYGWISNLRLNSTSLYSGNFTPPTSPLTAVANTVLLTCQSNRFIDKSSSPYTLTPGGTPAVQAFSPFAPGTAYGVSSVGGSAYFNGSTDYLSLSSSSKFDYSTYSTFTFECWIYPTTLSSFQSFFGSSPTGNDGNTFFYSYTTGQIGWGRTGVNEITSATGVLKAAQWNHVAFTGSSGTFYIYCNGVQVAGPSNTAVLTSGNKAFYIGYSGGAYTTGYISNFRFSNTVRYSGSTYTVPTGPFSNDANTILLTNSTNAGIYDQTAKNDLITVGSAQISTAQSKFGGSSIYFNGSTDYILIPDNPGLNMGSSDFTIEFWIYLPTSNPGSNAIFGKRSSDSVYGGTHIYFSGSLTPYGIATVNGSSWGINSASSVACTTGWNHLAWTRNGNTWRLFVNGTQGVSATLSGTIPVNTAAFVIGASGADGSSIFSQCYIDDFRVTKGYARYTSNFTPATYAFQNQ
jgi:Concanavalin A-like lectin/glucanases superfamily